MTRLAPLPLLTALLLVAACDETCPDPADAWALLAEGWSETDFEAADDGDVFEVERGSQGGMHVWVSVAMGGIEPGSEDLWDGLRAGDLPKITLNLEGPHGVLTPGTERPSVLERGDGEFLLLHQQLQFKHFEVLPENWQELDYAEVEATMEAQDQTLSVTIEDACGTVVTDELTIRLDFPERT